MVSEDFSFPKITNPLPHFAISPSLWRVSSVVYPDVKWKEDGGVATGDQEKMDMLWEDFNEELQRVSSLGNKNYEKMVKKMKNCHSIEKEDEQKKLQIFPVQALVLKTSSNTERHKQPRNHKKQSLLSVLKVFKKIFSKSTQYKMKN